MVSSGVIALVAAESVFQTVAFQTGIDHVIRVNALDILAHFIHPCTECQTSAVLAGILVTGFIHQIPCKNGGIVFILHTSEIVGTLCKVLGVVLIPLLAGLVAAQLSFLSMPPYASQ